MKTYLFKYDDITSCDECPFFYDYIHCEANLILDEEWHTREIKYTWFREGRPNNCPLLEVIGSNDV